MSDLPDPTVDDIVDPGPSDRRAELELELEHITLLDAYAAAKATRDEDPERYAAAKQAFTGHRTYWRQIGEAVGTRTPVAPIVASTGPKEA